MESISVPVYRSVEIRPKIFMRADSTSSTTSLMSISSQGLEEEDGKRLFRVSDSRKYEGVISQCKFNKCF